MTSPKKRQYLSQREEALSQLDLLAVQKESWQSFLKKGIGEAIHEISPISDFTGKNWELSFGEYTIGEPEGTPAYARQKGLTFSVPIKLLATLKNKRTEKEVTQDVFLGDIPQ